MGAQWRDLPLLSVLDAKMARDRLLTLGRHSDRILPSNGRLGTRLGLHVVEVQRGP